jgi:hypothetical protein
VKRVRVTDRARGVARKLLVAAVVGVAACGDSTGSDAGEPPTITTATLADGEVGVAYDVGLNATGGATPYNWSIDSGMLPSGLFLDPLSGTLFGTPTTKGSSSFTVRVTGDDELHSTRSLTLAIGPEPLRVLTSWLPDGVLDSAYTALLVAGGGDGTYVWSLASGALPGGLSMTGSSISGQPTKSGYFPLGIRVESAGGAATADDRVRVYETPSLRTFLAPLPSFIQSSLLANQELLLQNLRLASEFDAKIEMLSNPDLEAEILNGGYYREEETTTLDGRTIPLAIVFPADTMEAGALLDLGRLAPTLATLEAFIDVPWPRNYVREWYGFRVGFLADVGRIFMEDRGTYAERAAPYDAALPHELGHSYIGHEGLTQFLEMYGFNVVETGSTDVVAWTWKREFLGSTYVPFAPTNSGAWALLDIYQLIGPEPMGRAYAALHAMGVPFGMELSVAGRQTFVDEAPAAVRAQVAAIVPRV